MAQQRWTAMAVRAVGTIARSYWRRRRTQTMDKPDYLIMRQGREELRSHRFGGRRGKDRKQETENQPTQTDNPTEA